MACMRRRERECAPPACSTPAVAIILEMARTIIANPAIKLSAPVVFLLNGGEETLSQAANGFFASSRWGNSFSFISAGAGAELKD